MAEFNAPIDTLTEELGCDPCAAINTEEAAANFADPEVNAATEVPVAFLVEHRGLEPPPGGWHRRGACLSGRASTDCRG